MTQHYAGRERAGWTARDLQWAVITALSPFPIPFITDIFHEGDPPTGWPADVRGPIR